MVGFSITTWITFIIGFIASPIATRLFIPSELVKVSMFSTIGAIMSSICYLGLDQAFVRFYREPPQDGSQKGLLTFCAVIPLGFSLLSSAVLFFFWQQISLQIVDKPDMGVFLCLCLYSFCLVVFRFLSLCYRMEQNAKLYAIQGVVYAILTKIAYLAIGFAGVSGKAALLSLTVLTALFTFVCIIVQRKRFDPHALKEATKPYRRELFAFAFPLVPIAVLAAFNGEVSKLMLRGLEGMNAAGIYSAALGLAATINIIQTGFNAYWAPYVFENYKCDENHRFFTVHKLMACMLTLFGLLVTLFQAPVFLLLGENYRSSVIFFPFLFLSPICYCLGETTGMGIQIAKKSHWTTLIYAFSLVANIVLCNLLIPPMGMSGAAIASALSSILTVLLRTVIGEQYYKVIYQYRYLAYTIGLMFAASLGNLLLGGPVKYALLVGLLVLACVLFRRELKTLWDTALQVLALGQGKHARHPSEPPKEEPHA
ncbi:MAG: lipopolysaccharide biosynthesis protein [Clostridia bacterium]